MASFNKVMLMGNLTRDPQLKHLSGNVVVAEFGLAASRRYRTAAGEDKEEVAFVDCTAFGRQAETIGQFCTKGKPLFVEGRLKYDTWEDKTTRAKRSKLTVVVENFQFIGAKQDAIEFPEDMFAAGNKSGAPRESHPGTTGSGNTESGEKSSNPAASGPRARPGRRAAPAEPPFGGEKQFEEADIPF
jgi:single-strand DNA-binding protein